MTRSTALALRDSPPSPNSSFTISYQAEVVRKSIHLSMLLLAAVLWQLAWADAVLLLTGLLTGSLLIDVERLRPGPLGGLVRATIGFVYRPHEKSPLAGIAISGATWMMAAALLLFLFLDREVATAAFLMMVVGDPAAALVGRRLGRVKLLGGRKSLEGSLAFFLAAAIAASLVPGLPHSVVMLGALAACLVEAFVKQLDDNFAVPLGAGLVMQWLI